MKVSKFDKIWLSVPELIDWDKAVGFKYALSKDSPRYYDVRIADFVETLGAKEIDKAILLRRKIFAVDRDDLPVIDRPAYCYIYAELAYQSKTYLLNNGKWYLISRYVAMETSRRRFCEHDLRGAFGRRSRKRASG